MCVSSTLNSHWLARIPFTYQVFAQSTSSSLSFICVRRGSRNAAHLRVYQGILGVKDQV